MAFHLPNIEDGRVKMMAWLAVVSLLLLILNQGLDILKKLCDLKKSKLRKIYAGLVNVFKKALLRYTVLRNIGFLKKSGVFELEHSFKKIFLGDTLSPDTFKKTFDCDVSHYKKIQFVNKFHSSCNEYPNLVLACLRCHYQRY